MSSKKLSKSKTKWDEAISDAKRMIEKLKAAIEVYEERKAKGEPWPGESAIAGRE